MRSDEPVAWEMDEDLVTNLCVALELCMCSERAPLLALVRQVLLACEAQDWKLIRETLLPDSACYYAVLNWLEHLDLLEHGTAIRCAWPTRRGQSMLEKLNEWSAAGQPED